MIIEHDISNAEIILEFEEDDWQEGRAMNFIDRMKDVIPVSDRRYENRQWAINGRHEATIRDLREEILG